jgi:hydrogenase expression/formation protein HypE
MERILLSHGGGGKLMHELIDSVFISELGNPVLREKKDSAVMNVGGADIAFTTDSYVVKPLFFPGGDIGSLAVNGTVNDLCVSGAKPLFISLALIIEEGFDAAVLKKITLSIKKAAKAARVKVVTGDTKVVEKGACDGLFINTAGIGEVYYKGLGADAVRPGDVVIMSGTMGEHAVSVLSKREGIAFSSRARSDTAALNGAIARALKSSSKVRFMRDPTRGGVAATLNEVCAESGLGITITEKSLPVSAPVRQACELLGFEALYLACEGRFVLIAAPEDERRILSALKKYALSASARAIGRVTAGNRGKVVIETVSGTRRIVPMLSGEQLPRIC